MEKQIAKVLDRTYELALISVGREELDSSSTETMLVSNGAMTDE
jgi:hypothetical protein